MESLGRGAKAQTRRLSLLSTRKSRRSLPLSTVRASASCRKGAWIFRSLPLGSAQRRMGSVEHVPAFPETEALTVRRDRTGEELGAPGRALSWLRRHAMVGWGMLSSRRLHARRLRVSGWAEPQAQTSPTGIETGLLRVWANLEEYRQRRLRFPSG